MSDTASKGFLPVERLINLVRKFEGEETAGIKSKYMHNT